MHALAPCDQAFILTVYVRGDRSYGCEIVPVRADAGGYPRPAGEERAAVVQRIEGLSEGLTRDELYRRSFYDEATRPIRRMSKQMTLMIRQQGIMYVLSRLHRMRLENVRIKWHWMVSR